jgi:hypothetical protein
MSDWFAITGRRFAFGVCRWSIDGRPKLIGEHRKKDDNRATNHVAVCHGPDSE